MEYLAETRLYAADSRNSCENKGGYRPGRADKSVPSRSIHTNGVFSELLTCPHFMRSFLPFAALPLAFLCAVGTASAQRHDAGSSPPTAPPPKPLVAPQAIVPVPPNSGLGPLQFLTVNFPVSAPQSLASELQSSDDRMRTAALAAIGAPGQYMNHGHVSFPHSVRLDYIPLGNTAELDAILTVELDQHLLSAVLMPEDNEWRRIATVLYPIAFTDIATTPSTFLREDRSLLENKHYAAIFRATANSPTGDFTESEAHLRILNGHAVITLSFASTERSCDPTHQHPCDFTERWLQPDTSDPEHRFLLVTATGHVKPTEAGEPIAHSETFEIAHLRTFTCQPFEFSDTTLHFESTAAPIPCVVPHDPQHEPSSVSPPPPKD
jgi:hypothetical protein